MSPPKHPAMWEDDAPANTAAGSQTALEAALEVYGSDDYSGILQELFGSS